MRYQITVMRNEEAIEQASALVGWRIYATNASRIRLSLTDAVLAYRNQYLVEQPFGRLGEDVFFPSRPCLCNEMTMRKD
ncbi:MAG: hypothetical protein M5U34_36860 [Chloroflexi bacterium]|nr:hypothetical protein [Chloroflexota bacterium]